ncbi:hypothetical protein AK812_SmicGene8160 [Symbiodinium microadriaticum]|uniref:Uncharacterized protein n=1 Tax=Symbiodinium microadriaticum TaxID=2951 RepID=A0A1Q9ELV3_SYMMI|nr:hypothetical protein AK812_SmicGene8160 [Symbiodinium microadriaticum]
MVSPTPARPPRMELFCGAQTLCVLGCEAGGRWNADAVKLVQRLVALRAHRAPPAVRASAKAAWARRWWSVLSVAVQQAVAHTALGRAQAMPGPAHTDAPALDEVLHLADPDRDPAADGKGPGAGGLMVTVGLRRICVEQQAPGGGVGAATVQNWQCVCTGQSICLAVGRYVSTPVNRTIGATHNGSRAAGGAVLEQTRTGVGGGFAATPARVIEHVMHIKRLTRTCRRGDEVNVVEESSYRRSPGCVPLFAPFSLKDGAPLPVSSPQEECGLLPVPQANEQDECRRNCVQLTQKRSARDRVIAFCDQGGCLDIPTTENNKPTPTGTGELGDQQTIPSAYG